MISQLRVSRPARAALLVLAILMLAAPLLASPAAGAPAAVQLGSKESLSQYESQLNSGQIQSIVVNKRTRALHITLKNGEHFFVKYPKKQGPKYYAVIHAKHVPLTFLSPAAAKAEQSEHKPGHKIRYIAGGALILILAIAGGIFYFNRRRQAARD
jgi:hypothetical protein